MIEPSTSKGLELSGSRKARCAMPMQSHTGQVTSLPARYNDADRFNKHKVAGKKKAYQKTTV